MNCFLSTSVYKNLALDKAIENCGNHTNGMVELSAPHPHISNDEIDIMLKKYINKGFIFTFHNYFPPPEKSFVLNIAGESNKGIKQCKNLIYNVLDLSNVCNTNIYGIHAGYLGKATPTESGYFNFKGQSNYKESLENAAMFINNVIDDFDREGMVLLIENLFPSRTKFHSLFCSLEQIDDLLSLIPENVGLLLDLGHLNISANIFGFDRDEFLDNYLEKYGSRLAEIHISENNGYVDEHLPLTKQSWQLNALKQIKQIEIEITNERVYCLECRKASEKEIIESLGLINEVIV